MVITLCSVFTANSRLAKVISVKFASRPLLCPELCETTKQAVNLSGHEDGGRASNGIPELLETESGFAEISTSCHHEQIPRRSFCSTRSTYSPK
jgi:hypothetical protein